MYSVLRSYGLNGLTGFAVAVEADISGGLPAFSLVGLPDSAVRESGDRVRAAVKNLGFKWPDRHITVNLAPADVRKTGPVYDLNPISNIDPLGLETLKCIKPLHSMGGTGERSGPDIWGNPFYHQYLCVPDGKGDYTCGGQDQRGESKGDGLWGPGKASNDTKEAAGRCDLVETDNSCVENCLKGKFKEVRPRYSVLPDIFTPINLGLFKNCQDWSNDSLETCKMKCSGNNIGRFIRFVFTGVM